MTSKATLVSAIGICAVLVWAAAIAESKNDPSEPQSGNVTNGSLEEVVITARKREESFLDVPVVATVLTQATLEQYKTDDLFAIATHVPGLLLGNGVISVGTQVSLRGVGTTAINATMDQSVGLNIDGMSFTQGTAYSIGMFDLAQAEILKGPQALFFGKNNTAGVISLRSADPTDKTEIIAAAGYEREAAEKQVDFILSGPVTDSLKLRLAARYSNQEGFFINSDVADPALGGVTPGFRNFAPTKEWIVRGTALFEPDPRFTARLKLNYNNLDINGAATPFQLVSCPGGTSGVPPTNIAFLRGDDCTADRFIHLPWMDPAAFPAGLPNGGIPFEKRTQAFGSLDMKYDISSGLSLNSVTGYSYNSFYAMADGGTDDITTPYASLTHFHDREITQELRLTSNYTDSPVNYMVGAFYQYGQQQQQLALPGNALLKLPTEVQYVRNVIDIRSTSLFAQAMWNITPKLELAAGARWTDEVRTMEEFNFNLAQGPIGPVPRPDPRISSSDVSPEASLTYKPTSSLTLFATYKSGFKSGSFNGINFVPSNTPASFADEKVHGGELGLKALLDDRRLGVNVAAYYYKYSDLQVGAQVLSSTGPGQFLVITRTLNAASANVYGADIDGHYSPAAIHGLALNAALEYNHARYDSFPNAPCGNNQTISQGCNQIFNPTTARYTAQNLSGQLLVRAPDWTAFAGFDETMPLTQNMSFNVGAGADYTAHYSTVVPDLPGFEQSSFVKLEANMALRGKDDRWEVALIGRNLTNRYTTGWCANNNARNATVFGGQIAGAATGGPAGPDDAVCYVERGRELWGRVTLKF